MVSPTPAAAPSTPPLVLVVDDAQDNREMYAIFLRHCGFRVNQAADAEDALAQLVREPTDLVVADLRLPGLNGLDLCRRIRENASGDRTRLIALTGMMLREPEIQRVLADGADLLLFKPCLPDALAASIRDVLARPVTLQAPVASRAEH